MTMMMIAIENQKNQNNADNEMSQKHQPKIIKFSFLSIFRLKRMMILERLRN